MSNEPNCAPERDEPRAYQIRLLGQLDSEWAAWFGGLSVTAEADGTTLINALLDQAALHGLLKKVRDLGLTLISVNPIDPGRSTTDSSHPQIKGSEA